MLAVDVREHLKNGNTVEDAVTGPWHFSESTITHEADIVLAYATERCIVGGFRILSAIPVERKERKQQSYVFEIAEDEQLRALIGKQIPIKNARSRERIIGGKALMSLLEMLPA